MNSKHKKKAVSPLSAKSPISPSKSGAPPLDTAKFLREGLHFRQQSLQVFSVQQSFDDGANEKQFLSFVRDRLSSLAYLLSKRIQGQIVFAPEATTTATAASASASATQLNKCFLVEFCLRYVLPFARCISEWNTVLLDINFVRLLRAVSIILCEREREVPNITNASNVDASSDVSSSSSSSASPVRRRIKRNATSKVVDDDEVVKEDVLVNLLVEVSKMDYKAIMVSQPILLELLVESFMYCHEFERAEVVISEIVRTITLVKGTNLTSRDRYILGRFYLYWFACNPVERKNHLTTCNSYLNDARSRFRGAKLTPELSKRIGDSLQLSSSLTKIKDAKSAMKLVLTTRFNPDLKSGRVIPVVTPDDKFPNQLERIGKSLKSRASAINNQPISKLLRADGDGSDDDVVEVEPNPIPVPKTDEDFQGEYNEFLHTYDGMKVKAKKRKVEGALGAIAYQRELKKLKTQAK